MNIKNLFFFCLIVCSLASCSKLEHVDDVNTQTTTVRSSNTLIISANTPKKKAVQQFGAFLSKGIPNLSYYHNVKNSSGDLIITELKSNTLGVTNPTTGAPVTEESVLYEGDSYIMAFLAVQIGSDCPPYDSWQDGNGTWWVTDCC